VPKLSFPGGALIGCSAGFVNLPRIKGSHNAVLSGMMAAEHVAEAIAAGRAHDELAGYEAAWRDSDIGKDLKKVRNVKPLWSKFGLWIGVGLGGLDMWLNTLFGVSPFGTMKHGKTDAASLEPASKHKKIDYDRPDGVLTFDRLSSVFLSNTNHEEDQPVHLQVKDMDLQKASEYAVYAGPSTRYCPAGVYEWVDADGNSLAGGPGSDDKGGGDRHNPEARFVINAQNCVHCKTCDIKDPNQNINWVPPQGGEGPVYPNM
jgi:electron-transferring-flavoprotein dehydrogenase